MTMHLPRLRDVSPRMQQRIGYVASGLSLLGVIGLGAWGVHRSEVAQAERADLVASLSVQSREITSLESASTTLATELEKQRAQFEACKDKPPGTKGCTAAVAKDPETIVPSNVSIPPTVEQIRQAVLAYLTANPPADGRPPTTDEVELAVAAYFIDNPVSDGQDGRDGRDGTNGTNGADGQAGAPGPGPSDEQVTAAVAAFCAANGDCRGPAGEDGEDGEKGSTGEAGEPPFSWTYTLLGRDYSCSRVADFDRQQPKYTCEPGTEAEPPTS